jgi:hypothetical protein
MTERNKPPKFFPGLYQDEIQGVSKNALIDMVWLLCSEVAQSQKHGPVEVIDILIKRRDLTMKERGDKRRVY